LTNHRNPNFSLLILDLFVLAMLITSLANERHD
jgi:hypothetical protein